ncbi:MAG: hypothetical protein HGA75_08440 [Thiobacillus sp.]|nr:hypothetical protein [Thiobacillus sp.]
MHGHNVFLGAANWRYPHWLGAFYPSDMPAEWQLAYYNTQYSCLWLPYQQWSQATPAMIEAWSSDVHAGFRFILEPGQGTIAGEQAGPAGFSADQVVFCRADDPELIWFDAGVDLRAISEILCRRAASAGCTYLLSRDGDIATMGKIATLLGILNLGPGGRVG